jgi:hypothetical protein
MRIRENPGLRVLVNVIPPHLDPQVRNGDVLIGRTVFRPVWAGQGFPADIRAVVSETRPAEGVVTVVTARRITPKAQGLLAENGLSWADAAGYADIFDGSLHLLRQDPTPLRKAASAGVTWSRSADVVAEYVLARRIQVPGLTDSRGAGVDRLSDIAANTRLSTAQVAKVLTSFDEAGYTAKFGPERGPTSIREFIAPGQLLSDWAGYRSRATHREAHAELHTLIREPGSWLELMQDRLEQGTWAVSGWLAADELAPFATTIPDLTVYVDEDRFDFALNALTAAHDVTEVEQSGRIHLRAAPSYVFAFLTRVNEGPALVSPVRVYADLLQARGRGEDAADHLREVVIGF